VSDLLDRLKTALADRYALERELGAGGMATVYLAEDLKHHRKVAVKVLRPELAAVLGSERFIREIEIAAGLSHPHILPLHDSGEADGFLYYVMPYIEGESLRDKLSREKQFAIDDALMVTKAVASALDYAHRHGVIHRDIKPENILLHEGEAIVADFGIALAVTQVGRERLTETGLSLGTPQYMSPEQASGDRQLTAAADIYALACVAYEMLAGDPPHTASTTAAIIAKIMTENPTPLSVVRDSTPPHVEATVHRALSKVPGDRFQSAAEFAEALDTPEVPATAMRAASPPGRRSTGRLVATVVGAAAVVGVGYTLLVGDGRVDWARNEAIPEIARLADEDANEQAYRLALGAREVLSGNPRLDSLWDVITVPATFTTDPSGATVMWRENAAPDSAWVTLGTTPLAEARIPAAFSRYRLELDGHYPLEVGRVPNEWRPTVPLRPLTDATDAAFIAATNFALDYEAPGLWQTESVQLGDFLIDRYEVTNRQFKEFVDAGGYRSPEFWTHPFERNGRRMSWEEAIAPFVDATGRPGPAGWEVGDHPAGQEDYPVTGVSWYEAEAYARFRGRDLPTVFHWYLAASTLRSAFIHPLSNLQGTALAPVGEYRGVTRDGLFDIAGNAREWAYNARGDDERYILGGGWNDPFYSAVVSSGQSPMDRSPTNGFRLMTHLGDSTTLTVARQPILSPVRDFASESPVSDDIFDIYRRMYAYDPLPLNTAVELADTTADWIRERVSFDATYGNDRVIADVYLPRGGTGPFQTVVYFPGSGSMFSQAVSIGGRHPSFLTKSGRAFVFPVYSGMYERDDGYAYPLQDESSAWREHVIQWGKDLGRTIDYLETRSDIDAEKIAYMGFSLGGRMGGIMLAVEPRLRLGLLVIPGFSALPTLPEVDPFNFTSRVTVPVIMFSGRYDNIYPLETAARPMFNVLGTPSQDKRHVISETGHFVVWNQVVGETLAWMDRYLGAVEPSNPPK
jgi:cephalosporin-C deacetylase-like acetyl esterase